MRYQRPLHAFFHPDPDTPDLPDPNPPDISNPDPLEFSDPEFPDPHLNPTEVNWRYWGADESHQYENTFVHPCTTT